MTETVYIAWVRCGGGRWTRLPATFASADDADFAARDFTRARGVKHADTFIGHCRKGDDPEKTSPMRRKPRAA